MCRLGGLSFGPTFGPTFGPSLETVPLHSVPNASLSEVTERCFQNKYLAAKLIFPQIWCQMSSINAKISSLILFCLLSVTEAMVCSDGRFKCRNGQSFKRFMFCQNTWLRYWLTDTTCCRRSSDSYGCCPLSNGEINSGLRLIYNI